MLVFACAALVALVLTPWTSQIAHRLGAVDRPDGGRKMQAKSVALGGGLVVLVATVVTIGVSFSLAASQQWDFPLFKSSLLLRMAPGALVLLVLGLIDDAWAIRGKYKLLGQILAVSLLIYGGMCIHVISLFGLELPLGIWAAPFTMFFFLGTINAFNLLDGADGLAASIGVVVCLTLGCIAVAMGSFEGALLCFAFSGALAGFLKYNAPPASIYLGDTGSMLIGMVVAVVATHSSIKQHAAMALIVPVAICAIPVLDATAALVRRLMTGQSIFTGDRGHLHHALLIRGWSVGRTVLFIAGLTAITCGGALASFAFNNDTIAIVVTLLVFVALSGARIFGHAELALVRSKARSLVRVVLLGRLPGGSCESQETVHIQGHRGWENLWEALLKIASDCKLSGIKLNVNIPRLHESYYGNWERPGSSAKGEVWQIELPLKQDKEIVGRLSILGNSFAFDSLQTMQRVIDSLEPLESDIAHLIGDWPVEDRLEEDSLEQSSTTRPQSPRGVKRIESAADPVVHSAD